LIRALYINRTKVTEKSVNCNLTLKEKPIIKEGPRQSVDREMDFC